jgi:arylsulfatase A-like enzyme
MKLSILALLPLCFLLIFCSYQDPQPPNILFLFADDQRADTISAYGNPSIQTPNLDRLVARGFSFRTNYNMGSQQGAVCVPSRAMVNTGLNLFGVSTDLEGARTLPEILGENGYITFATGKWHNERPSWLRSFKRGKNIFFGGMSDHTKVPIEDLLPEGILGDQRVGPRFSSELFADAVIEFLQNYSEEAPFYAYVPFTAPHDPRQPPHEFRQMYYENPPPLPDNFMAQHPFDLGPHITGRDERLAAWPRDPQTIVTQL